VASRVYAVVDPVVSVAGSWWTAKVLFGRYIVAKSGGM
jgi:fluoroquinolone transport system permease protein